jgi:hypothetical protein
MTTTNPPAAQAGSYRIGDIDLTSTTRRKAGPAVARITIIR